MLPFSPESGWADRFEGSFPYALLVWRLKKALHAIWRAKTRADAEKAFELFLETYEPKYPKATVCLQKDREELLAFYSFPAQHWQSIRTTNPIESTFATICHRTRRSRSF